MKNVYYACLFCFFTLGIFGQTNEAKGITICWDTSLSMSDRELEKELSVLDKIFERNQNQTVQVLFFNIGIEEQEFDVRNGNWQDLKTTILSQQYDGGTMYSALKNRIKYNKAFVFTDGNSVFTDDFLTLPPKSVIVNSKPERNLDFLRRTALITRSRLMDFAVMHPKNKKELKKVKASSKELIKGSVYAENKPAPNVRVRVKGSAQSTLTDKEGRFSINAVVGDSLLIGTSADNELKTIPITKLEQNIFLKTSIVALNEVVVVEERLEEEVFSGYGKENKEKIGYAVQSIGEDDIRPIQTNVRQSIQNRFSGVSLANENDISQVTTRTDVSIISNNYGLIVIDGVPQQQSDSSTGGGGNPLANFSSLDPSIIANITVLKGLVATNRYGTLGRNGVILITTKNAVYGTNVKGVENSALLKNNVYEGEIEIENSSPVFNALKSTTSDTEAYQVYKSLQKLQGNRADFYVEASKYFKETNPKTALRIVSNLMENNRENLTSLRTTALFLSSLGAHEQAISVLEQIIRLYPTIAQPYLDVALEKKTMGNYQGALEDLLALSEGTVHEALNIRAIQKSLKRELHNLIAQHENALDMDKVPSKYTNNLTLDVRLVFEWNDPTKEFEIQFVNPKKRFFNWKHDENANGDRVQSSIVHKATSEEFEFYGADVKGEWIINANYIGDLANNTDIPLLLKCSVYKNYGRAHEDKKEFLVSLRNQGEKKMIHTFNVK